MAIKVGDKLPDGRFTVMNDDGPGSLTTDDLFTGKKVVLFAVPGAFTPTCSNDHLPGFIEKADEIRGKGIDIIACMAVNDVFVMDAWGKDSGAGDKVMLLADGNGDYAKAMGLDFDGSGFGLGTRCQRFAMVVDDGVVSELLLEENPGELKASSADKVLSKL
ncbi:MAG: peroxiredoxin [Gammaproteobacteria bacterium]